ncbi:unnamed protein product, partial [Didymodactylos carnosus]
WLSYVPSLLTSKARIWYEKYKATILDFDDFVHKLTTEFGSKATVTAFSTLPSKPSLKLKILEKQPTSISEFLSCAKTFEQLADLMKNDSLATATMHEVTPRYVAPQRRYEPQQPQHPYLNGEFQCNDYGRFSMDLNPSVQEQSQSRQTASASNSAQQPLMESEYNSKGKRYYIRGSQRLQNYTGCYICKALDHYARDCMENQHFH